MKIAILFLALVTQHFKCTIKIEQPQGTNSNTSRTLPEGQKSHQDPTAYESKFNPHLQSVMGSHPLNYMMYQGSGPYGHMLMNPMMNPMMMNPYMMGMSMMGMGHSMMGGLGMMMPGMSMYPFMNPYLGYQGPYGPNSPYNSGESRKLLDEAEPPKQSNQVN